MFNDFLINNNNKVEEVEESKKSNKSGEGGEVKKTRKSKEKLDEDKDKKPKKSAKNEKSNENAMIKNKIIYFVNRVLLLGLNKEDIQDSIGNLLLDIEDYNKYKYKNIETKTKTAITKEFNKYSKQLISTKEKEGKEVTEEIDLLEE
jgi:hypothetical protein